MFKRHSHTYNFTPDIIKNIIGDVANPLNRISDLIPDNAKVLDIGAGNGLLAHVIREKRKGLIIDGIEPDPYAAQLVDKNYRHFYIGYAQDFKDVILKEGYDFIVLADVIEHINDPQTFLLNLCSGLPERTRIILSIPNIAFGAVRLSLLNGEFNYVDSGLLEKTHVRFFTLKTIEMLCFKINMNIEKLYFLQRNIFESEIDLNNFNLKWSCLSDLYKDELASTYQFLLVLTKEQVTTEKRYFGEKTRHPFISYVFRKLRAKNKSAI